MINTIREISTACDDRAPPFEPEWTSPGRIVHRALADGMAADQGCYPHLERQLQQLDQAFGIGMKEAKVSHPPESARVDVPE